MKNRLLPPNKTIETFLPPVILLFVCGSLCSLGVFNSAVEKASIEPEALDNVWASSMAIMSIFSVPSMLYSGYFLHNARQSSPILTDPSNGSHLLTIKLRKLAMGGAASYAALACASFGLAPGHSVLFSLIFVALAVPFGMHYLVALEILAAWMPLRPGLAIGCGNMAFGFGTILYSSIFQLLLETFATSTAFKVTAIFLCVPSSIATLFLSWPPQETTEDVLETDFALHEEQSSSMSLTLLSSMSLFWLYISTVFSSVAGYAFFPFYFKMSQTFGLEKSEAIRTFQTSLILCTIMRPLAGVMCDKLKWGNGMFSIGSKNTIILLLMLQTVFFYLLILFSLEESFNGFMLASTGILTTMAASSSCASLLARELFGYQNSSLVFGVGASIGIGAGEAMSSWLLSAIDLASKHKGSTPSTYIHFYTFSLWWSLVGLLSCSMMQRDQKASVKEGDYRTDIECVSVDSPMNESSSTMKAQQGGTDYGSISNAKISVHHSGQMGPSTSYYMCDNEYEITARPQ